MNRTAEYQDRYNGNIVSNGSPTHPQVRARLRVAQREIKCALHFLPQKSCIELLVSRV